MDDRKRSNGVVNQPFVRFVILQANVYIITRIRSRFSFVLYPSQLRVISNHTACENNLGNKILLRKFKRIFAIVGKRHHETDSTNRDSTHGFLHNSVESNIVYLDVKIATTRIMFVHHKA